MLSLGLILAVLTFPSRGGQVNMAHAAETTSMFLCSEHSVPFGLLRGPERPRADHVLLAAAAWTLMKSDCRSPGTKSGVLVSATVGTRKS